MTIIANQFKTFLYNTSFCKSEELTIVDQQSFDIILINETSNCCYHNSSYTMKLNTIECKIGNSDSTIQTKVEEVFEYAIDEKIVKQIQNNLRYEDVVLSYDRPITIESSITWDSNYRLTIKSEHSITFKENVQIFHNASAKFVLLAGMDNSTATVNFMHNASITSSAPVRIYYNPIADGAGHKFLNPTIFNDFIESDDFKSYMLIHNHDDLAAVNLFPSMDYALAHNITSKKEIFMHPIGDKYLPFTGCFDGNGFTISNITIIGTEHVGLFGIAVTGGEKGIIENFRLNSVKVSGDTYVGSVAGITKNFQYNNIYLENINVIGKEIVGGVFGVIEASHYTNIQGLNKCTVSGNEFTGDFAGVLIDSEVFDKDSTLIGVIHNGN